MAFTNKTVVSFDPELLETAAAVRKTITAIPTTNELQYPSSFQRTSVKNKPRGFCNWIIPNRIMVGQYPGQTPETDRPSPNEVQVHLRSIVGDAGIDLFCSLQSELPSQDDDLRWADAKGQIYLDKAIRRDFPNPFTRYGNIAKSINPNCRFVHHPIEDLNVPSSSESLLSLLSELLTSMKEEDRRLYIHCWGGRGRAGLVSSCLVSLLFPELDSTAVLDLVQAGYSSRDGAKDMARALSQSPQTESQRAFVRAFVEERQKQNQ